MKTTGLPLLDPKTAKDNKVKKGFLADRCCYYDPIYQKNLIPRRMKLSIAHNRTELTTQSSLMSYPPADHFSKGTNDGWTLGPF